MKHPPSLAYKMGEQTWTITTKEWVEEEYYVPPEIDDQTGWYTHFGMMKTRRVWKETTSKPFVF